MQNKRRFVSNDELIETLNNKDVKNIVKHYCLKFKKQFDDDDLQSISMYAVWRCLQYYKEEYNKKFTSNLCIFLKFEFLRELKRQKPKFVYLKHFEKEITNSIDIELNDILEFIKNKISLTNYSLIKQFCLEKRKPKEIAIINGWSIDYTKKQIKKSLNIIGELLCQT